MNKSGMGLSGLLALQLLLAAGLFWGDQSRNFEYAPRPLFNFDKAQINKVAIHSGDDAVTMVRRENDWILPQQQLPVNQARLDSMLTSLNQLKTHWPVTTTSGSHRRFQVSEQQFERRIQLYQNDEQVCELFLGSSPGFRQVHIRAADQDNVYTSALNTYDFPATTDEWLDKTLLTARDINAITGSDYQLKKSDGQWMLVDAPSQDTALKLNLDQANQLNQALTSLRVTGVAKEKPDFTSEQVVSLHVSGAAIWHYQFIKQAETHYVKRDDLEQVFTLAQPEYDRLASVHLSDLTQAAAAQPEKNADAGE